MTCFLSLEFLKILCTYIIFLFFEFTKTAFKGLKLNLPLVCQKVIHRDSYPHRDRSTQHRV
jgi:hypothetical protein